MTFHPTPEIRLSLTVCIRLIFKNIYIKCLRSVNICEYFQFPSCWYRNCELFEIEICYMKKIILSVIHEMIFDK